mgnify:CR=1 FL=1
MKHVLSLVVIICLGFNEVYPQQPTTHGRIIDLVQETKSGCQNAEWDLIRAQKQVAESRFSGVGTWDLDADTYVIDPNMGTRIPWVIDQQTSRQCVNEALTSELSESLEISVKNSVKSWKEGYDVERNGPCKESLNSADKKVNSQVVCPKNALVLNVKSNSASTRGNTLMQMENYTGAQVCITYIQLNTTLTDEFCKLPLSADPEPSSECVRAREELAELEQRCKEDLVSCRDIGFKQAQVGVICSR